MGTDIDYIDRILFGIALIRKYEPNADISADHDVIYYGSYETCQQMTKEERRSMKKWGWIEEYDLWAYYV